MNDDELIQKQIEREKNQRESAYSKFKKDIREQTQRNDGSNAPYARHWKSYTFAQLLDGLQNEIDNPNNFIRSSRATEAVKNCLGTPLVIKRNKYGGPDEVKVKQQKNYFDLERCSFIAFQITLDNAQSSIVPTKIIDRKTGKPKRNRDRKDKDSLINEIGKAIEIDLEFNYISKIYPQYFDALDKSAQGGKDGTARSSTYYWRDNIRRALRKKKLEFRRQGREIEADALDWRPFTSANRKLVGSWLLDGLLKYTRLFKEERVGYVDTKRVFIVLSDEAEKHKEEYIRDHEPFLMDPLPMICKPVPATKTSFGSWLTTLDTSQSDCTFEGSFEISEEHLAYINKLQDVPYRINPFVADVLNELVERGIKLGKFIPHFYQDPPELSRRLGLTHLHDHDELNKALSHHPNLKQAKKERAKEISQQIALVEKGFNSKTIWLNTNKLRDCKELYYPCSWDFRGRAYVRCSNTPSPQGSDFQKALLLFAKPKPIDDRSKFHMSIELANNAGQDKCNFDDRLKWTESNQHNIKLVATLLEPNGDFNKAISFLETTDNPFQFLAAAKEYYHCFIRQDQSTTSLRCSVDATCSGAAVMAAIRLCKTSAKRVNVLPSTEPQDLYRACWMSLVEDNLKETIPPIRTQLLGYWSRNKLGRKAAKKIIMVAQYGAGEQRMMEEFWEFHDSEVPKRYRLNRDEMKAFRKLWMPAMNKVCSFKFVLDWFQQRAQEIHNSGKKKILVPTPSGSTQIMKYPIYDRKRIKTFHYGSLNYKISDYIPTKEADLKDWRRAITANTIHSIDASIMVKAFRNFNHNFSTIHDAAHTYASKAMDEMTDRLKEAFIEACSFNIWDEFRKANDLNIDNKNTPPIVGNLDLQDVKHSDYIFS
jgi:hypothetical protein